MLARVLYRGTRTANTLRHSANNARLMSTIPSAHLELARRAQNLKLPDNLDAASHSLGSITLEDGRIVPARVIHTVDAMITDGTHIVMITRRNPPGQGKQALPGGFLDPKEGGGVETPVEAAEREAREEALVGVDISLGNGILICPRNMYRPHDIRITRGDGLKEKYDLNNGDIFMVSTQFVRFDVPDLQTTPLVAGDDAASASLARISSLNMDQVGIREHFWMIREEFPDHFMGPFATSLATISPDTNARNF